MSVEQRFGYAFVVFAAGNAVLAAGNAALGNAWRFVGSELANAVGFFVLGGAFVSGRVDADASPTRRRLLRYGTPVVALAGLALVFVGGLLVLGR